MAPSRRRLAVSVFCRYSALVLALVRNRMHMSWQHCNQCSSWFNSLLKQTGLLPSLGDGSIWMHSLQ